ncbi:M56 family metallopeptidase [Lysobacter sp. CA199]|uniref:M56 family metallopeptidase n=1 Tax=Lysobacter sp. CA199 TaxID=3455608 RepID=UPI003F8D0B75
MSLDWIGETLLPRLLAAGVQSLLVVAAVWALCRYLRLSASVRCWLWWFASLQLLVGALWPTPLSLPLLPASWNQAAIAEPASAQLSASAQLPFFATRGDLAASAAADPISASALDWLSWPLAFAALWLSGFALVALASARGYASARRRVADSQPCEQPHVLHAYRTLGDALGLSRLPPLRLSAQIDSPQLIGPPATVLLPRERMAQFSAEDLAMALHHELVHVRRRDLWWGWVPAMVQHLFFFHPLAHVIAREYSIAREAACDAAVLESRRYAAQDYGRLLLRLGVAPRPASGVASASPTYTALKRRLLLLQNATSSSQWIALVLTAAVVLLGLVPYRVTAAASERAPKTESHSVSIHSSDRRGGETRITELSNGGQPAVWAIKGDQYYRVRDDGSYEAVRDSAIRARLQQRMRDARQAGIDAERAAATAELAAREGERAGREAERAGRAAALEAERAGRTAEQHAERHAEHAARTAEIEAERAGRAAEIEAERAARAAETQAERAAALEAGREESAAAREAVLTAQRANEHGHRAAEQATRLAASQAQSARLQAERAAREAGLRSREAARRAAREAEAARDQDRRDAEQARRDAEQARRDRDQDRRNAEQAQRNRAQAQRDAEQARRDARQQALDAEQAGRDARQRAIEQARRAREQAAATPYRYQSSRNSEETRLWLVQIRRNASQVASIAIAHSRIDREATASVVAAARVVAER